MAELQKPFSRNFTRIIHMDRKSTGKKLQVKKLLAAEKQFCKTFIVQVWGYVINMTVIKQRTKWAVIYQECVNYFGLDSINTVLAILWSQKLKPFQMGTK